MLCEIGDWAAVGVHVLLKYVLKETQNPYVQLTGFNSLTGHATFRNGSAVT